MQRQTEQRALAINGKTPRMIGSGTTISLKSVMTENSRRYFRSARRTVSLCTPGEPVGSALRKGTSGRLLLLAFIEEYWVLLKEIYQREKNYGFSMGNIGFRQHSA